MNLIDLFLSIVEVTFTLILVSLIFLAFRTIFSLWFDQKMDTYQHFTKGKLEYIDSRPISNTFSKYFYLAQMTTGIRQENLTQKLSELIKDYLEIRGETGKFEFSANLSSLITDPNKWFRDQQDKIIQSGGKMPDFLQEQFIQIIFELQQLTDIILLPKED